MIKKCGCIQRRGNMGLFTKSIGPVFLKASNQAEEYIIKTAARKKQW